MGLGKTKLPRLLGIAVGASVLAIAGALLGWRNYGAALSLHQAQQQDRTQNYNQAQHTLSSINQALLLPGLTRQIKQEQAHNAELRSNYQKPQRVKQLLLNGEPITDLSTIPEPGSVIIVAPHQSLG